MQMQYRNFDVQLSLVGHPKELLTKFDPLFLAVFTEGVEARTIWLITLSSKHMPNARL